MTHWGVGLTLASPRSSHRRTSSDLLLTYSYGLSPLVCVSLAEEAPGLSYVPLDRHSHRIFRHPDIFKAASIKKNIFRYIEKLFYS